MRQFIDLTVVGVALSIGLFLAGGAQAEVISSAPADQVDAVDGSGCGEPLTGGELHELTGGQGQDIQVDTVTVLESSTRQNASMPGNSIVGPTTTGYNMIAAGAFTNVNGIAPVIQNSGNHVIINNSINLNLYVD
ncbi:hypothetical protein [Geobacter sp.]|uniref:hypothetical protein n=1 Tax=Geobacter sp. TaxID=46610 RepID=UPI0027BAF46E|nr:hypothetical protein [Geobacter sp.]